jgi:hypothetical protein
MGTNLIASGAVPYTQHRTDSAGGFLEDAAALILRQNVEGGTAGELPAAIADQGIKASTRRSIGRIVLMVSNAKAKQAKQ